MGDPWKQSAQHPSCAKGHFQSPHNHMLNISSTKWYVHTYIRTYVTTGTHKSTCVTGARCMFECWVEMWGEGGRGGLALPFTAFGGAVSGLDNDRHRSASACLLYVDVLL